MKLSNWGSAGHVRFLHRENTGDAGERQWTLGVVLAALLVAGVACEGDPCGERFWLQHDCGGDTWDEQVDCGENCLDEQTSCKAGCNYEEGCVNGCLDEAEICIETCGATAADEIQACWELTQ